MTVARALSPVTGKEIRVFWVAAIAAATSAVGVLIWTGARVGGVTTSVAVQDISEAVAGLLAAAACVVSARRASAGMRAGWWLLAASALSWSLGETVWSVYEVGLSVTVPFPSYAHVGFVLAVPLAVAGILTFPSAPSSASSRARAVLDGAIVGLSALFVAWAIGLGDVYDHSASTQTARLMSLAYPAADMVVITVLALTLRRASGRNLVRIVLLLGAFAAILTADSSFAYLNLQGHYGLLGGQADTGWVVGYLMLGLAAMWPDGAISEAYEDGPVELWQLAMPWIAVLAVIVTAAWFGITGRHPGPLGSAFAVGLGLLFLISQALTLKDSVRLITTSRRAEAHLKQRTALLNQVIDVAPLGIARIGVNLRFIDANPRLSSLLRLPLLALRGSSIAEFMSVDEFSTLKSFLQAAPHGIAEPKEGDSEVRCADSSLVWLHWTVTAVRDAKGDVDYYLAMFEDITAKHEAEQAAAANLAGLEHINRLKSEFMSMVSHEFRTALTGIQGYSELMSSEEITPDEVKEFSGDINSDALRLNRMITEMLDLDRIESGRITLHRSEVDLNQVLRDATERAQVTTARHAIKADLEPALPRVDGDLDRLTQVVTNLLSNAIKYSPDGGEVLVTSRSENGKVEICVKDHGQGIPPEFTKRIFGRYERYEGNGPNQVVGTGLGLAIAQQIVQLHNGAIWVESTPGVGSEFRFSLPVRIPDTDTPPYRLADDSAANAA